MPTYSYRCTKCGHEYDAFQSMKDDPHTECPECGGKVERLIGGGAGIVFKGSGFYVTDYKKSSGGSSSSGSSGSSGGSGSSSGSGNSGSSGSSSGGSSSGGSQAS
ncbi:MAG TPA: FmdB family transcriptional regulator [Leptospiraceae bacterium]|nr:FmdB family transcriptional regulator [Spirochaetaceae bacterium]HBS04725.1 FmdB family transcriptional regulator [Leptospiraceae bacterium]